MYFWGNNLLLLLYYFIYLNQPLYLLESFIIFQGSFLYKIVIFGVQEKRTVSRIIQEFLTKH